MQLRKKRAVVSSSFCAVPQLRVSLSASVFALHAVSCCPAGGVRHGSLGNRIPRRPILGVTDMARPSWSGFLRFNLISVPVKGYTAAAAGGGKIGFHLLHAACHSRIKYKKVCPIHGEVHNDEIVSGYEASKGHYVTVDKEERTAIKAEDEKTIAVDTFVPPDAIDPLYFSGRSYFLVPDGKVGQKPYA